MLSDTQHALCVFDGLLAREVLESMHLGVDRFGRKGRLYWLNPTVLSSLEKIDLLSSLLWRRRRIILWLFLLLEVQHALHTFFDWAPVVRNIIHVHWKHDVGWG